MSLLRPEAVLPKVISGGGRWSVRKPRFGGPAFCLMLEGSCRLDADGLDTVELGAGDFLLLPQTPGFTLGADRDITPTPSALDHSRHTRHGAESDAVTMRMLAATSGSTRRMRHCWSRCCRRRSWCAPTDREHSACTASSS